MRSVDQGPHGLEVRAEDALRFVVGMADIMPGLMPLTAEIT
jgi:hypothetical protein